MSIWSSKRMRDPNGRLIKHKARLCAHGGMEQCGELLGDLLPSDQLDVCKIHDYSEYYQRASHQVSKFCPSLHPG